jgi:diguanylate cyclase (GGDEF)-like protein/PAS domain S-box-containing protein
MTDRPSVELDFLPLGPTAPSSTESTTTGDVGDDEGALRARVRELEEELARERARAYTIFQHIPAVFYVKDLTRRYVYGSPFGFEMFGVTEDPTGKTDDELFPPALAARFAASDKRLLAGETVREDSYAVPTARGPRHFASVRFPIPGPDGEVTGICGFAVDITERVEMARELERLATTDPLTGLANRRRFDERLDAELARAARSGEPLSLLLCDVDRFKAFNDRYGHVEGDRCLARVAKAIESVARRAADLSARYGGEELAIVLPDTAQEGAIAIAERAREAVRALALPHADNDDRGVVTFSVGVATVMGGWTRAEVLDLADRALYRAKAGGRDRHVAVYEEHPPGSVGRASK